MEYLARHVGFELLRFVTVLGQSEVTAVEGPFPHVVVVIVLVGDTVVVELVVLVTVLVLHQVNVALVTASSAEAYIVFEPCPWVVVLVHVHV